MMATGLVLLGVGVHADVGDDGGGAVDGFELDWKKGC